MSPTCQTTCCMYLMHRSYYMLSVLHCMLHVCGIICSMYSYAVHTLYHKPLETLCAYSITYHMYVAHMSHVCSHTVHILYLMPYVPYCVLCIHSTTYVSHMSPMSHTCAVTLCAHYIACHMRHTVCTLY